MTLGYSVDKSQNTYLDNLKEVLLRAVEKNVDEFNQNPDWDGILVKDKSKLRDIFLDDILEKRN